jgi:hypothetical protein
MFAGKRLDDRRVSTAHVLTSRWGSWPASFRQRCVVCGVWGIATFGNSPPVEIWQTLARRKTSRTPVWPSGNGRTLTVRASAIIWLVHLRMTSHDGAVVTHPSRWRALVAAVAAVRSTDSGRVEAALQQVSGQRRWLAPLALAAGTVAVVFDGILLLMRNWRLTLLQLVPAVWIYGMTWNLRNNMLAHRDPPVERIWLAALIAIVVAQVAYWCNATFAYTLLQGERTDIGSAFREARSHWRFVGGLALLTGAAQATLWLLLPTLRLSWFWAAMLTMFVVQIYMFIAVPAWLIGVHKTGTRRERTIRSLTTGVLSGVAAIPGFLLNRIGLLLLGAGTLWLLGVVLIAIAVVLHVTASSSVRVVKMSVRLRQDDERTAPVQLAR